MFSKGILALVITYFLTSSVYAQTVATEVDTTSSAESVSARGFRVGLVKPFFKMNLELSRAGRSVEKTYSMDEELGISLGYASLPIRSLGFTTSFTLMQAEISDEDGSYKYKLNRLDGNLAYAFNETLHIKGGLNVSKFTNGEVTKKLDPALGLQIGLGLQLNRNMGFDLNYVSMNQSEVFDDVDFNVNEQGIELGVHATF